MQEHQPNPTPSQNHETDTPLEVIQRQEAEAHEAGVWERTRPQWPQAEPIPPEEPWRTAFREQLTARLAEKPDDLPTPEEVTVAFETIETAGTERYTRGIVIDAVNALYRAESYRRFVQIARDEAAALVTLISELPWTDLNRRCVELADDINAHVADWTPAEVTDAVNVRIPALRTEINNAIALRRNG